MKNGWGLLLAAGLLAGCGQSAVDKEVNHWRQIVAEHIGNKTSYAALQEAMKDKLASGRANPVFADYNVSIYDDADRHCNIIARFALDKKRTVVGGHVESQCIFKPPARK